MAGNKVDKSPIYWKMTYAGRYRRTKLIIVPGIIIGIAAAVALWPDPEGAMLLALIVVVGAWQLAYTKRRAEEEAAAQQGPSEPVAPAPRRDGAADGRSGSADR